MPNGKKRTNRTRLILQSLVLAALCVALVFIVYSNATYDGAAAPPTETAGLVDPEGPDASEQPAETPESTPEPTPEPTPTPFEPHSVESTDPSLYISGTAIEVDGVRLAEGESYEDDTGIYFGGGDSYTDAKGVLTFRGNNYRDTAAYGTAQMTQKAFGSYWTHATGSLMAYDGAYWSGNGWTGQPLITEWPYELRQHMNLYDWAKQQETLVEVIYPSMDGCVYFLELETGKQTRDTLNMGLTYKGTGTLDPRGYPLLYIGSGYDEYQSHVSIVSLIDCSVLYEFGGRGDTFAIRGRDDKRRAHAHRQVALRHLPPPAGALPRLRGLARHIPGPYLHAGQRRALHLPRPQHARGRLGAGHPRRRQLHARARD